MWHIWVFDVEFLNQLKGVCEGSCQFPAVGFIAITYPFDEVLELPVEDVAVQDVLDFVLLMFVDNDRRRQRFFDNAIVMPGAEVIDMKDVVDL